MGSAIQVVNFLLNIEKRDNALAGDIFKSIYVLILRSQFDFGSGSTFVRYFGSTLIVYCLHIESFKNCF